jgi:hypothetical protein
VSGESLFACGDSVWAAARVTVPLQMAFFLDLGFDAVLGEGAASCSLGLTGAGCLALFTDTERLLNLSATSVIIS